MGGEVADFPLFFPVKTHHVGFCWKVSQTSVKLTPPAAVHFLGKPAGWVAMTEPALVRALSAVGFLGEKIPGALAKQKKSKRNPSVTG